MFFFLPLLWSLSFSVGNLCSFELTAGTEHLSQDLFFWDHNPCCCCCCAAATAYGGDVWNQGSHWRHKSFMPLYLQHAILISFMCNMLQLHSPSTIWPWNSSSLLPPSPLCGTWGTIRLCGEHMTGSMILSSITSCFCHVSCLLCWSTTSSQSVR